MQKKENKGFTMIELLAVVVILGIVGTLGVAGVMKIIKSAHERHNLAQAKVFISSAQTYFSDNKSKLPTKTLTTKQVSLRDLVDENYIEKLVDYNKKEYDLDKSYAFVTRMGTGYYAYDGELLTQDGERTKYKPNTNSNSSATFKMDSQTLPQGKTKYTNKVTNDIGIDIKDPDRIAVYRVSMYRQNKRLKELEYREVGETSYSTTIKLQTKDYPDGIYNLRVDVYDIYNNKMTFISGNIVIDTLPPECSLNVSGTRGNGWDLSNPQQVGWYKEKNVKLTLTIKEKNEDAYSLKTTKDKNYITYTNDKNYTKVFNKEQSDTNGITYYTYARDKAGNETKCGEVRLQVDTKAPECNNSGGNSNWTNQNITLIGKCTESSGSGCEKEKVEKEYTTDINATNQSPGTVYDKAGNAKVCPANQTVKIDKTPPTCTVNKAGTLGNNSWYVSNVATSPNCNDDGSGCNNNSTQITTSGATTNVSNQTKNSWNLQANGASTLTYTVFDNVGNSNTCSETIKKDTASPTCTSTYSCGKPGNDNWCRADSVPTSASCSDGQGSCSLQLKTSGETGSNYAPGTIHYTDSWQVKANGESQLYYTAYDEAGNSKKCDTLKVKKDSIAPSHKELCVCREKTSATCPTGSWNYILKYALEDNHSGVQSSKWKWSSNGSSTMSNSSMNPEYGSDKYYRFGYICVSKEGGPYEYTIWDEAGNSTTGTKKLNNTNKCQKNDCDYH